MSHVTTHVQLDAVLGIPQLLVGACRCNLTHVQLDQRYGNAMVGGELCSRHT
jgi:hypothetical protein